MDLKELSGKLTKFEESAAQISILIITLAVYLLTKQPLFGVLVALEFIAFVALEIQQGVQNHGVKHELLDTLKSLGIALLIWLAISAILRTTVPVSAVVSCSMLPNLQRGDLTIIHGTTAAELRAPEISATFDEFRKIYGPQAQVNSPYGNFAVNGSMYSYCMVYKYVDPVCNSFYSNPAAFVETRGPLTFTYANCDRKTLGSNAIEKQPCITTVEFNGTKYVTNLSNDIIVYSPNRGDLFSYTGDIIHRVFLKIKTGNQEYVLTKGDNNNVFDIQFYDYQHKLANTPVSDAGIKGANIFAIPYVGYFKLFISGFVDEPVYCDTNLVY